MAENEQLAEVELSMLENKDPEERETETKENIIEESTEQKKSIEETNVTGKVRMLKIHRRKRRQRLLTPEV